MKVGEKLGVFDFDRCPFASFFLSLLVSYENRYEKYVSLTRLIYFLRLHCCENFELKA